MKAALYARVSTTDQDTEMQLSELRTYCERRGFDVYQEFVDTGISGSKERRPALDRLLNDARKRKFDVVLVWRFDRFARSTKQLILALEEFKSLGIDFVSYQENIDTTSPAGKVLFTMIGAFAEFEREIIRERVMAGIRKAKAQGKRLGRPSVDTEKALRVKQLRRRGISLAEIARTVGIAKGSVFNLLSAGQKTLSGEVS